MSDILLEAAALGYFCHMTERQFLCTGLLRVH